MSDDVLWVRNVARYPLKIGKDVVLPGAVWGGERGFVMIALKRYPGRLVFVERPSPPAPLPESGEGGKEPHPSPPQIGEGVDEGMSVSEDNPLLSAQEEPSPPAPLPLVSIRLEDSPTQPAGEGRPLVKRRRRKAKADE